MPEIQPLQFRGCTDDDNYATQQPIPKVRAPRNLVRGYVILGGNGNYAHTLTPACQDEITLEGVHVVAFAIDDAGSIALFVTQRPSMGNIASNIVFMYAYMEMCLFQRW